ncbi:MAG: hypothetical protein M3O36_15815 [Myxococcota bacterium]|nr:hypothetical protein [Myxococcota bacterium]
MNRSRVWFLVLLCLPAVPACVQALDSSITEGPATFPGDNGGSGSSGSSGSQATSGLGSAGSSRATSGAGGAAASGSSEAGADGGMCQNGFTIDPSTGPVFCTDNTNGGNQPIVTQTPGIELPDGGSTVNPCDLLEVQSVDIRNKYCAACHGHPGLSSAPFHTIMDDRPSPDGGLSLLTQTAAKLIDDAGSPALLVYPGDPDHSLLYLRVAGQTMPPGASSFGQPGSATPNVSEVSLLRSWIQGCLGGGGGAPPGDAGDAATGDDGGGTVDTGGPPPTDASTGTGGGGRDAGRIRDAGGRG